MGKDLCYHVATPNEKGGNQMPTNQESLDIKKAMAYDLMVILKGKEEQTFTAEELEKIIHAYIVGLTQK